MSDRPDGAPEVFPYNEEQVSRARELVHEYDDTVKHNRVLSREQTLGQFMMGSVKGGLPATLMIFGVDKLMEVTGDKIPISDKFSAVASAATALFFGVKRVMGRRGDADRIKHYAEERAAHAPHTS